MISNRALRWSQHDQELVTAHFNCAKNGYDPENNPGGYVNFGTAENKLLFDDVLAYLKKCNDFHEPDSHYDALFGASHLREALVPLLGKRGGRPISADNIVIASGASAILEMLSFSLCDPGDCTMIAAPYYTGFDHDLALRSEAKILPVHLESPNFELTPGLIKDAYERAKKDGHKIKAFLLNSPQNPLGQVYDEPTVRELFEFFESEFVHMIFDEMYAESLLPGACHFSALRLQSSFVHVVYGFAKDFGLSGYKVGMLHSENPHVLGAAKGFSYFHTVSGQTQRTLSCLLNSADLVGFFEKVRAKINASCRLAMNELSKSGIEFVEPRGGIFIFIDLRKFLSSNTLEGEKELFRKIYSECKVNISPGHAFQCAEPGWFRLCYAVPHAEDGLRRLTGYLSNM